MSRAKASKNSGEGSREAPEAAHRFGVERILRELEMIRARPGGVAAMDRRQVLAELVEILAVEEALVLERGFDRAYRQIVEGV